MNDMGDTSERALTNGRMIAASRVSGTTVYDSGGSKIGSIDDIMIDKLSGSAKYAVLSFGGFLGIGDKHHPLPWNTLKYDQNLGGYVVNITRAQLENGPAYGSGETPTWDDEAWDKRLNDYYTPPL